MKTLIVIKKVMFDGAEIAIDSAVSYSEARKKWIGYIESAMPVNAYELNGTSKVRLQF